jgi:integrase
MPPTSAVPAAELPALPAARPRELAPAEITQLLHAGDAQAQLLVGLLVSGAAVDEIEILRGGDLVDGVLRLGTPLRPLDLAPSLQGLWSQLGRAADAPLFATPDGTPLTRADLLGTLVYVAHDAGVARPEEVTADALRHTGFAWWVRQGLKLGELPRLGGLLTPAQIASYASYAPPGAGRTLTQIGGFYPALADAVRVDGTAADTV